MIKKDIVNHLHQKHGGMTLEDAEHYTNALLEILRQAVREDLTVTGFGRFKRKARPNREVVLPSGERSLAGGGERIQFLPSPKLKAFINAEPKP